MAIMGIVLIQNVTMLEVWDDVLRVLEQVLGTSSYAVLFTLAFVLAVGLPVAALAVASRIAAPRSLEGVRENFARFGYALIPLDVAGHLAHNLFHLLAEGKAVYLTALPLFGRTPDDTSAALVGTGTIQLLQFLVLGLGIAGSLYTLRRIGHRRYQTPERRRQVLAPYTVVIVALAALNVVLFLMPMAHRM
jgi:hypothetical protein